MCIPGITSDSTPPVPCTSDSQCTTNGMAILGFNVYGDCICGYSNNGGMYCTMFPGDQDTVNVIDQLSKAISDGVLANCNIDADYTECIVAHWDNANAVKFEYYWFLREFGTVIAGGDDCTFEVLAPEAYAWSLEVDGMGVTTIFIASMGLLALA